MASHWINVALDRIAIAPCGYFAGDPPAAEPAALAALALTGAGRIANADVQLRWLASIQRPDGSVAPFSTLQQPGWPTALACVAFAVRRQAADVADPMPAFDIDRALQWLLESRGKPLKKSPDYGHDVGLVGWPWVAGTHSWQEPTAWSVLALKAAGLHDHPRTREGIELLRDRLIDTGGCNYGNTVVLRQRLRPHIEPTGLTLVALAGEVTDDPRIERSLQYLRSSLSAETASISLSYGMLGLAAFDQSPDEAAQWLAAAYRQTVHGGESPLSFALLLLAAQGRDCRLIASTMPYESAVRN